MSDTRAVNARRAALGAAVLQLRTRRRWSVNEAAAATRIAPMTWRRIEAGMPIRSRSMLALARILELPPATVAAAFQGDDEMRELLQALDAKAPPPAPLTSYDPLDFEVVSRVITHLARPGASPAIRALIDAAVSAMPDLVAARQAHLARLPEQNRAEDVAT